MHCDLQCAPACTATRSACGRIVGCQHGAITEQENTQTLKDTTLQPCTGHIDKSDIAKMRCHDSE